MKEYYHGGSTFVRALSATDATFDGHRLAREVEDEDPQHQKPYKREQKMWGVPYNPGENPDLEWRM